jgi:hypothetical protein
MYKNSPILHENRRAPSLALRDDASSFASAPPIFHPANLREGGCIAASHALIMNAIDDSVHLFQPRG